MPGAILIRKSQCQDQVSVIQPPTMEPTVAFGHVAAPFGKGWGSTVTWERMEPALGFFDS
ncbi:hypothetical protein [Brevundimonas diminuta]|uniref:hypothetical protein n=1 Tax=Brevundimonas diminuta TaxID=293 RepID=UPI0025A55A9D|nr:hypothetical protein [Brevundimonas diminuta]MDM8353491.1 hypothetical protein [Brevundimonas diminuta]